jgi:hypothetical protein
MDFIVATIPTMLALSESARLVKKLREENVPVKTIVVNQIVGENMSSKYLSMKLKEQQSALKMVANSPNLSGLEVVRSKMLDLEVRGLPALQYVSSAVWTGIPAPAGGQGAGLVKSSAFLHLVCTKLCFFCFYQSRFHQCPAKSMRQTKQLSRPNVVHEAITCVCKPWSQHVCMLCCC